VESTYAWAAIATAEMSTAAAAMFGSSRAGGSAEE
jgi:hypothetical protein